MSGRFEENNAVLGYAGREMEKLYDMREQEKAIEAYLTKQVKQAGGLCYKFTSGVRGVPDRLVISPATGTFFVELKRPGEKERKLQRHVQKQMRQHGARVYSTIDSREKIDEIIRKEFPND